MHKISKMNCIRISWAWQLTFFLSLSCVICFNITMLKCVCLDTFGMEMYAHLAIVWMWQSPKQWNLWPNLIRWKIACYIARSNIFIIYYLLNVIRQEISRFSLVPSGFCPHVSFTSLFHPKKTKNSFRCFRRFLQLSISVKLFCLPLWFSSFPGSSFRITVTKSFHPERNVIRLNRIWMSNKCGICNKIFYKENNKYITPRKVHHANVLCCSHSKRLANSTIISQLIQRIQSAVWTK